MTDLMREEFEAWLRTRPEVLNIGFNKGTGRYVLREDEERWEAWQASRESLVIKLPKEDDYVQSSETAMFFLLEDVREAVHAAGVKTK